MWSNQFKIGSHSYNLPLLEASKSKVRQGASFSK